MSAFEDATNSIQIQTMMILARPAPNTPPARYQGRGRRRFNGAVKTHNKKPQLPLNGALRDSVRTRGGGLRKAAGTRMRRGYHLGLLRTWGRFRGRNATSKRRRWWWRGRRKRGRIGEEGQSCLEDLAAEQEAEEEDFFGVS